MFRHFNGLLVNFLSAHSACRMLLVDLSASLESVFEMKHPNGAESPSHKGGDEAWQTRRPRFRPSPHPVGDAGSATETTTAAGVTSAATRSSRGGEAPTQHKVRSGNGTMSTCPVPASQIMARSAGLVSPKLIPSLRPGAATSEL